MPKKKVLEPVVSEPEVVTEPESDVTHQIIPPRSFHDVRVQAAPEDEPFQLGEMVYWKGKKLNIAGLNNIVGEVVDCRYCNMFGDVTDRVIRFDVDGRFVWVRARVGELSYA